MIRKHRYPHQIITLLSLLLIWLLITPWSHAKDQTQSVTTSRSELILAMNTLRVSYGLPPLIEDPIVNAVAQATAEIMAANDMSWHIGDVRGRIAAAGYGGGGTVWATENFAVGRWSIDEIMQMWADPDHMRPAVNPAYCHVGAGVAQAADGSYYYVLQAAYTSEHACGEYKSVPGADPGGGSIQQPPVSQIIIPVKIATPDIDGRIYHIIRSGQSFWSIAIAYQITIRDLEVWNNLSRANDLSVGQKLFIPSSGTEGYATPTPVGMVVLATPDAGGKIVHEVQPYQALIMIAQAYRIKVERILAMNGLQVDLPLQIGQKLLIDPGNITPSPTQRPLSPIEKLTPASDGKYYHTVRSGEYLAWIADLYDVSLAELTAWNGLNSGSIIHPGHRLLLLVTPPATNTPTPVLPAVTSTVTQTPATPTPIPTTKLTATPPGIAPTASVESQPNSSLVVSVLLVLLVGVVVLILFRAGRRR